MSQRSLLVDATTLKKKPPSPPTQDNAKKPSPPGRISDFKYPTEVIPRLKPTIDATNPSSPSTNNTTRRRSSKANKDEMNDGSAIDASPRSPKQSESDNAGRRRSSKSKATNHDLEEVPFKRDEFQILQQSSSQRSLRRLPSDVSPNQFVLDWENSTRTLDASDQSHSHRRSSSKKRKKSKRKSHKNSPPDPPGSPRRRPSNTNSSSGPTSPPRRHSETRRGSSPTSPSRRPSDTKSQSLPASPRPRHLDAKSGSSPASVPQRHSDTKSSSAPTSSHHRHSDTKSGSSPASPRHSRHSDAKSDTSPASPRRRHSDANRSSAPASPRHRHSHTKSGSSSASPRRSRHSDAKIGSYPASPRHHSKPTLPPLPGPPPLSPLQPSKDSIQDDNLSKNTNRHINKSPKDKTKKKILKAPAPPCGSDKGKETDNMESCHHLHCTDKASVLLKDPAATPSRPTNREHKSFSEEPKQRKSLTKAVVAAAVSDATVHGRAFSHKDVRLKEAMKELSDDAKCSQHLQSMGQSFKARPASSPATSPARATGHASSSSYFHAKDGSKTSSRHSAARPSSSTAFFTSPQDRPMSGAVQAVLESSENDPEIHFKVRLLESLFEEMNNNNESEDQGNVKVGDGGDGGGDRRSSSHRRDCGILPPRDIEKDAYLLKQDPTDLEKGPIQPDQTTKTSSTTKRKSFIGTLSGIFRIEGNHFDHMAYGVVALGVAVLVLLIVVVTLTEKGKSRQSEAPFYFDFGILPAYTRQSFDNIISPQSRAHEWLENDANRDEMHAGVGIQRFVLATLFFGAGGHHWKRNDDWISYGTPECDWYNYQFDSMCNGIGQVNTLNLPNNYLQGYLPEELELLSSMNIVQLQNNELHGELPERIWSSWKKLVYANFGYNLLSGSLSTEVGRLADAKYLNTLNLRANQFSGTLPSELGLLNLNFLSLSQNKFTGTLPTELGNLSNLVELYLYGNRMTGSIPSTLGQLSKLTRLELHKNEFSGSVPKELCLLVSGGNLTLTVDCVKVLCFCGCDCTASLTGFESDPGFDKDDGSE